MEIRTSAPDGILLYTGQRETGRGDFFALILRDGFVELRFNLGSGVGVVKSATRVQLNRFHRIQVNRFGKDATIRLDDGVKATGSASGSLASLNIAIPLYIGSFPQITPQISSALGGISSGLIGCVERLSVSSKDFSHEYSLISASSSDIKASHGVTECSRDPCVSLPCQNGGRCVKVKDDSYRCDCASGWSGINCGKSTSGAIKDADITVPEFHGNSLMSLRMDTSVGRSLSIQIWFLAKKLNGLILYSSQENSGAGDFISLTLNNGYLSFRFDLGSGLANITIGEKIALNRWHRVDISRTNRLGTISINGGVPSKGQSEGILKELNLNGILYLGGYPYSLNPSSGASTGFTGAIQRVYEDGRLIENLVDKSISRVGVTEYDGQPCPSDSNPCLHHGVCLPLLNDYECKCRRRYSGKKCETKSENISADQALQFDGRSFHRYLNQITTRTDGARENHIELSLRTTANDGLVFLARRGASVSADYLALAVSGGHLEASFNLGKQVPGNLLVIRHAAEVSDGRWHSVTFIRTKRKATLTVDGQNPVTTLSEQGATQLNTDGYVWIGGSSSPPRGLPRVYQEGFTGCIRSVSIDRRQLHLVEHRVSPGSVIYCN